ncbi:hypothetical protein M427DRAFT_286747 [Gonapodya prolifera JEL478]|uniref:Uncharacterized protein n=1 Tax=Gonapodya prolifera (strain JEL478) TaxID=1344416 RepID=A0A139AKC3_GONPJ|nr:hypothetical protein M427DRAFT_286747 [Gonapodya prolifera JEL478]|eukprot:KXS16875.1 hypothetical protein M427DRAFT_286747 [Gonapodya prolifera JEL478]
MMLLWACSIKFKFLRAKRELKITGAEVREEMEVEYNGDVDGAILGGEQQLGNDGSVLASSDTPHHAPDQELSTATATEHNVVKGLLESQGEVGADDHRAEIADRVHMDGSDEVKLEAR